MVYILLCKRTHTAVQVQSNSSLLNMHKKIHNANVQRTIKLFARLVRYWVVNCKEYIGFAEYFACDDYKERVKKGNVYVCIFHVM